jgi:hypothetical protein
VAFRHRPGEGAANEREGDAAGMSRYGAHEVDPGA